MDCPEASGHPSRAWPNGLALSRFSVIYATPLCVITPRSPGQGARGVQEHLCLTRPYVSKARTLARSPAARIAAPPPKAAFTTERVFIYYPLLRGVILL